MKPIEEQSGNKNSKAHQHQAVDRREEIKPLAGDQRRAQENAHTLALRYDPDDQQGEGCPAPYIASARKGLPDETVIDGELVALASDGRPNFNLLENYRPAEPHIIYYQALDGCILLSAERELSAKEDILMSKEKAPNEMSRAEIIKKLQGDGVDTIEKLVDRLLAFQTVPARSTVTPAKSASARGAPTPEQLKNIHYTPPQVPLYVDGVLVEPAAISGFDGQILNFVIARAPGGEGQTVLHAFTGNDHISFLKGSYADSLFSGGGLATRKESPDLLPLDAPYSFDQVQVFQDINYLNNWTWFQASSYLLYPDLRNISRGCFLWFCGDWNDQISSMGATNTKVVYYWDINFSGPTLTVYPYIPVPDLRVYGWNDAISSVWNIPNQ